MEIIPPLRKSSGTVQYWCGPCNRRLASKIVYERHLKSDLHYKRTLHEREFDDPTDYLTPKKDTKKDKKEKADNKKRKSRSMSVRCEVCRSKVFNHLMGKHLISHYHCRKKDLSKVTSQKMVLDNILSVVLQAPFQCSICRFYCNTEQYFLEHWRSQEHQEKSDTRGYFWCSFCKFECLENDRMEEHLLTENHREVISVINRSMPIVIRKLQPVRCGTCSKQFRYNFEMIRHCTKFDHTFSENGTDKYQEKHRCGECSSVFKSNKSLQNHLQKRHGKNYFFCTPCGLNFESYLESKIHRRTQEHKFTVLGLHSDKDFDGKDISKVCKYCYVWFPNILYLKEHLKCEHPEYTYR